VDSTEPDPEEPSFLNQVLANLGGQQFADSMGSLGDKAQAGLQQTAAGQLRRGEDADFLREQQEQLPWYRRDVLDVVGLGPDERAIADANIAQYLSTVLDSPEAFASARAGIGPNITEDFSTTRQRLTEQAAQNEESAKDVLNRTGFGRGLLETAQDVAGSPESALSVFGGLTSAIPAATVYAREYDQARSAGLGPEEADEISRAKAAIELGVSSIPAGRVLSHIPGINKLAGSQVAELLMGDLAKVGVRVTKTAAGEAVEEGVTELAQLGVDKYNAMTSEDPVVRRYAESNLPKDVTQLWDQTWRAMKAGALGGTALGGPLEGFRAVSERGKQASELQSTIERTVTEDSNLRTRRRLDMDRSSAITPIQESMFLEPTDTSVSFEQQQADRQRQLEIDAAYALERRRPLDTSAQRETAQESNRVQIVARVDTARQSVEQLQDRVEAGDTSAQTLSDMTRAVREQSQAEATLRNVDRLGPVSETRDSIAPRTQVTTPVQTELPLSKTQEEISGTYEARTFLAKETKKADDAAKSRRAKARRDFRKQLLQDTQDLDTEQRVDAIFSATEEWDSANPVTAFSEPSKVRIPARKSTRPSADPVQDAAQVESAKLRAAFPTSTEAEIQSMLAEDSTTDQMSARELRKSVGLARTSPTATDVTPKLVADAMVQKLGKGSTKKLAKLITDGNIRVVTDTSVIPGTAVPTNAGGWYDGQQMYVVANRLDPENIVGDVLNIAAHEVKHAADLSNRGNLKATMGEFIGEEANARLGTTIERMASQGNTIAKQAVEAARKGSQDDTSYSLELPAYFINATRDARTSKGRVGAVVGDIVSAVRTAAKRIVPGDYDVNPDDVAYLSDKLLEQAAVQGTPLTTDGPVPGLSMIYDNTAEGFERALQEGLVYTSADGVQKFVLSDAGSVMKPDAVNKLQDRKPGDPLVTLADLMQHDVLYSQHPDAANIKVFVEEVPGFAQYDPRDGSISLSPDLVAQEGVPGTTIRQALMHETQHWVQDRSNRSQHFFDINKLPSEDQKVKAAFDKAREENDKAIRRVLDLAGPALRDVPATTKRAAMSVVTDRNLSDHMKASELISYVEDAGGATDPRILAAIDAFEKSLADYRQLQPQVNAINRQAHTRYERNITEAEAFFTQDTVDVAEGSLPLNPEQNFRQEQIDLVEQPEQQIQAAAGLAYNPEVLDRAAQSIKEPAGVVITRLKQLFGSFGGLGRELGVMKEMADGMAATFAHKANKYYTRLNSGIAEVSKRTGQSIEQVQEMVETRMQAISELDSDTRRQSALAAFIRDNPELKTLGQAVATVNGLSRALLRQMLEANPDPTAGELKLMNTIHDNSFRYTTTLYSAFQGEEGRRRNTMLDRQYEAGRSALAKGRTVPDKFKDSMRVWTSAQKYLIDHDLTIPDTMEGFDGMKQDKLDNLFATWRGDPMRLKKNAYAKAKADGMNNSEALEYVRETMRESLLSRSADLQAEDYRGKADALIRGMLDLDNAGTPFADYYRGFKQDRSILERKQTLPKEIKELFGEITNPAIRLAVTIAKQGELVGRTRMLLDMRDAGTGTWIIPPQDAGLPGNERFSSTLSGETFGPLKDWRTTPEIAGAMNDTLAMYSTVSDALAQAYTNSEGLAGVALRGTDRALRKGAGLQKMSSVVIDVWNLTQNALGSPIMLLANGVTNPKVIAQAAALGVESVVDAATDGQRSLNPEFERKLEELVRYGVMDSARVQEIRRTPQKFVRELISTKPKAVGKVKHYGRLAKNAGVEAYAMADAWVKAAAFDDRSNMLRSFYAAEGTKKSEEQIKAEAASDIKDTNITYARTPAAIRWLESRGLTTFMPYFVSVYRSIAYNNITAFKDAARAVNATTPKGKAVMGAHAAKRLVGAQAATMGITLALKAAAEALAGDEEDRIAALKQLMYPDARFSDSTYLGDDSSGVPLFMRMSRIDPLGPANDMLRIVLDDNIPADRKRKFLAEAFRDLVITNRSTIGATKIAFDYFSDEDVKDKNTKLERISGKWGERFKELVADIPTLDYSDANTIVQFLDSFIPGVLDSVDPRNKGVTEEGAAPKNDTAEALSNIVTWSGGRLDRADPGLAAFIAGAELSKVRDEYRKRLAAGVESGRSPDELLKVFQEGAQLELDAMIGAMDVYDGLINGMEMTPRQAMAVLKDDGNMTAVDISAIRQGRTDSELSDWLSKNSRLIVQSSMEQRTGRNMTATEKKELEKRQQEFIDKAKATGYKVSKK
jgi:hypothetical protein